MIYLDNAATTMIKPASVRRAVVNAMNTMSSPGRGAYESAMRASETMLQLRESAAELFNVKNAENVVFTMNATHGLNIAISSLVRAGDRVLISGFEHNSVTRALAARGADIEHFGSKLFDRADTLREFRGKISTADCVVCTHVSNVFGYILPVYEISAECREHGVPLIVDASQSAGVLEVDAGRLDAEFIAMPGHKALFGPPGSGILICKNSAEPMLFGGSGSDSILQTMPDYLPERLEAGTQNVWAAAGLTAGIRYVTEQGTDRIAAYERTLRERMKKGLEVNEKIKLYTGDDTVQSGVLSFNIAGMDCEEAAEALGKRGICVRSGLHCAPTAHASAGTLKIGTVRASVSALSSYWEIDEFIRAVNSISERK